MKSWLVDLLRCPMCRGRLRAKVFSAAEEVEEGMLACAGCARTFPIINGIPRLLPDPLACLVRGVHADFFARHEREMAGYVERCRSGLGAGWWAQQAKTLRGYSYQWRKFKEMLPQWEEVFRESIDPIEPEFFRDRRGLDAGCGFGRSLYYAASYGAEVVGMDLSEAVEAARENTRHFPKAHLVHGDIFHPPFQEGALDFVYSIGVLHHLPDPEAGFLSLARLLAPGAPIFIWVYGRGRGRQIAVFTLMRALSVRLPLRLLDRLCLALAAGQWALCIAPYRILNGFRPTRGLARRIPFTLYSRFPFRVLHGDWFDGLSVPLVSYYRREEIAAWFQAAGLERVRIDPDWGGRALGHAPAAIPLVTLR